MGVVVKEFIKRVVYVIRKFFWNLNLRKEKSIISRCRKLVAIIPSNLIDDYRPADCVGLKITASTDKMTSLVTFLRYANSAIRNELAIERALIPHGATEVLIDDYIAIAADGHYHSPASVFKELLIEAGKLCQSLETHEHEETGVQAHNVRVMHKTISELSELLSSISKFA